MNNNNLLTSTIRELMEQAKEDGVITLDEFEIIEQVRIDVNNYTELLRKAYEDNIITEVEQFHLNKLKDRIKTQAEKVARTDGKITEEEKEILEALSRVLINISN